MILGQRNLREITEITAMQRCTGLPLDSPILQVLSGMQSALAINELQFLIRCMFWMLVKHNQFCLEDGLHAYPAVLLLMFNVNNGRFVE